jgi:hypothetical protein
VSLHRLVDMDVAKLPALTEESSFKSLEHLFSKGCWQLRLFLVLLSMGYRCQFVFVFVKNLFWRIQNNETPGID